MNPGRFFIPNMGPNLGMNSMIGSTPFSPRFGLFSRIANGIKNFNWSGLLSGANKTLNVVNQTIPLIKQTKPMVSNVRNMIHLAKAFKTETKTSNNQTSIKNNIHSNKNINTTINEEKEVIDNRNYPSFFI